MSCGLVGFSFQTTKRLCVSALAQSFIHLFRKKFPGCRSTVLITPIPLTECVASLAQERMVGIFGAARSSARATTSSSQCTSSMLQTHGLKLRNFLLCHQDGDFWLRWITKMFGSTRLCLKGRACRQTRMKACRHTRPGRDINRSQQLLGLIS